VVLAAYKGSAMEYAEVLLPIAPFTETSGTYINTEGTIQSFNGVVSPLGDARPAWKVLRVLANLLGLEEFDYETPEQIRSEIFTDELNIRQFLNNHLNDLLSDQNDSREKNKINRVGEIPIYRADPIVRRAESLQATKDSLPPKAWVNLQMMEQLGIKTGEQVRVTQGESVIHLEAACDEKLPMNCVRIAGAHQSTKNLGGLFDEIQIEKL